MNTVAEIIEAIQKLPPEQVWQLGKWLDEFREQLFDAQIIG